MGVAVVSFSSSSISQNPSLEDTLSEKLNLLTESIFIEHFWLVGPPVSGSKYVNITVVNTGEVGVSITDIEFVDSSDGTTLDSFSVIGLVKPKETVSFEQPYNWLSQTAFDIILTTDRGNSFKIKDVFSDASGNSPILTGVTPGIPDVSKSGNNQSELIPLEDYFQDPEDLDDLNYTLIADTFSGSWLTFPAIDNVANTLFLNFRSGPLGEGSGIITIRATDSGGLFIESTFNVSKT